LSFARKRCEGFSDFEQFWALDDARATGRPYSRRDAGARLSAEATDGSFVRKEIMVSRDFIFWEVDTQADFMLPAGKLYVPGAEKLLPNIRRLTDAARQERVFLVSHGCFHGPRDREFQTFPPHCVKGTAGAEFVPEALTDRVVRVPNDVQAKLPQDLSKYQQILLEKQTLNIFESLHAEPLVEQLGDKAEFVVFGVVTEYCVNFAAKGLLELGRRVAVVQDAIATLKKDDGEKTIAELRRRGARMTTAEQALRALGH
jgi:nicotinamidase/pyrazinamidase